MILKRSLSVVSLVAVSLPVVAADINNIQALNQAQFRLLSEDLGAALSYKPLTPTTPLGIGLRSGHCGNLHEAPEQGGFQQRGW